MTKPAKTGILPYQSPDKDEDPSLLAMPDGSVWVFWFSDRPHGGSLVSNVVACHYADGKFGELRVITDGLNQDVYANAALEARTAHVCWFRRKDNSSPGWIVYRTMDLETGALGAEVDVTHLSGANNDWVPSIAASPTGALTIAYARAPSVSGVWDLMWTQRGAGGWSAPEPLPFNSSDNDNLPILANVDGNLTITWVRHPRGGNPATWERRDTEVWLAREQGGRWQEPLRVTPNPTGDVPNLFPSFFVDHRGRAMLAWERAEGTALSVVAVPVAQPDAVAQRVPFVINGYSPRIARLTTPGDYLAVFVTRTSTGQLDIAYQLYSS